MMRGLEFSSVRLLMENDHHLDSQIAHRERRNTAVVLLFIFSHFEIHYLNQAQLTGY
jgi:hypothetical protein